MIDKPADNQYPIYDLLRQRWSPLAFSNRLVEPEKLCSVLEAARWAASAFNEQPWSFIIATRDNGAEFERLLSCLAEGNQEWARNAPVLMLSVAKLHFERNGVENRHAFHNVGAAAATLAIQAAALGLFIHQMAEFDVEKARELFSIPAGYEPVAAMPPAVGCPKGCRAACLLRLALGYQGDSQTLSERLQQREVAPRTRKVLEKFVFSGSWEQTSPLVASAELSNLEQSGS